MMKIRKPVDEECSKVLCLDVTRQSALMSLICQRELSITFLLTRRDKTRQISRQDNFSSDAGSRRVVASTRSPIKILTKTSTPGSQAGWQCISRAAICLHFLYSTNTLPPQLVTYFLWQSDMNQTTWVCGTDCQCPVVKIRVRWLYSRWGSLRELGCN